MISVVVGSNCIVEEPLEDLRQHYSVSDSRVNLERRMGVDIETL